jgi:hypothetical protein
MAFYRLRPRGSSYVYYEDDDDIKPERPYFIQDRKITNEIIDNKKLPQFDKVWVPLDNIERYYSIIYYNDKLNKTSVRHIPKKFFHIIKKNCLFMQTIFDSEKKFGLHHGMIPESSNVYLYWDINLSGLSFMFAEELINYIRTGIWIKHYSELSDFERAKLCNEYLNSNFLTEIYKTITFALQNNESKIIKQATLTIADAIKFTSYRKNKDFYLRHEKAMSMIKIINKCADDNCKGIIFENINEEEFNLFIHHAVSEKTDIYDVKLMRLCTKLTSNYLVLN